MVEIQESNSPMIMIEVTGKLLGGKGGFGSMLRAQGGRMSKRKASSYDSCRNLEGIRIGAKKQATALAAFIQEEPHREREKEVEITKAIDEALNPTEKKYYAKGISEYLKTQNAVSDAFEQAFADYSSDEQLSSNEDNKIESNSDSESVSEIESSTENEVSESASVIACK